MARCPYCKKDGIDKRGLIPHIRMSDDDAHAAQGTLPDDVEDSINEEHDDVEFVTFDDVDADDIEESPETHAETCPSCGGECYHFEEEEPIEWDGEVIGYGEAGDVICLDCGEIVEGEVNAS